MKTNIWMAAVIVAIAIVGYGWMQHDASIRRSAAIEHAAQTRAASEERQARTKAAADKERARIENPVILRMP